MTERVFQPSRPAGAPGTPRDPGKYERTPEFRAKMSASRRERHGVSPRWGDLTHTVSAPVDSQTFSALDALNGASRAEHIRRALAAYLESQR